MLVSCVPCFDEASGGPHKGAVQPWQVQHDARNCSHALSPPALPSLPGLINPHALPLCCNFPAAARGGGLHGRD